MDSRNPQSEALTQSCHHPVADQSLRAIGLFTLSVFLINIMNGLVKIVSDFHTPLEIMFYRGAIALPLLLIWSALRGRLRTLGRTSRPLSHFGRCLFGNIGLLLIIWSYSLLPMADVTATLFASTLMVTALSALILKEKVGPWRWGAVIAGFIGVLMIVQPAEMAHSGYIALVPLAAALFGALVQIYLRDLGKSEDSLTTVFYFLLFGVILSGVFMIRDPRMPDYGVWLPVAGIAFCGLVSLIVKSYAFSLAEASLLSPFNYTAIVWATLIGWFVWGDIPTPAVICGTAIIILSNLFILYREKVRKRSG